MLNQVLAKGLALVGVVQSVRVTNASRTKSLRNNGETFVVEVFGNGEEIVKVGCWLLSWDLERYLYF
jgi:hypothetical protein